MRQEQKRPPPHASELPSLRLAPQDDDDVRDDDSYYDGDVYEEPSRVGRWLKRAVLIAVLGGLAFVGATTWQTWLPKVDQFSMGVMAEIDRRVSSPSPPAVNPEEAEQQKLQEAMATATEELPHLTPETIRALMDDSLVGVLEPAEVFRRAHDAVERGRPGLAPEESQELKALQDAVLAALGPAERTAVREYDAARGMRMTLAFEDRQALTLIARGARELDAGKLERLRVLSGKAIAAAPPSPVPAPSTASEAPAS
jgi:hypothetical protein